MTTRPAPEPLPRDLARAVARARGEVIVNPASAGGATGRRWPGLEATLRRRGLRFATRFTRRPGEAGRLARQAREDGARWVLCVGGDGTVNEVVNGLADADGRVEEDIAIGFIPSGTGLDLARNLGIPMRASRAARVVGGALRRIDLGRVRWRDGRQRLFLNMAGAGLDAEVAARAVALRRAVPGKLAYALGILAVAPRFRPRRLMLSLDTPDGARTLALPALMVVGCNAQSYGGGMRLAPGARLDDGLLQVVVVEALPPLVLLARLPSVYWGGHLRHPGLHLLPARRLELSADAPTAIQADGEPAGMLPAVIEVVPRAATMLV